MKNACNALLTDILLNYTPACYLKRTHQPDFSHVPQTLNELWYSPDSPSLVTIPRTKINATYTDIHQVYDDLQVLKLLLAEAFDQL